MKTINTEHLNESLREDLLESEDFKNTERIIIDIESNKEILLRKKTALLQILEILKGVICYGELDGNIKQIEESLEETDYDLEMLDDDLNDLIQKERVIEV